MTTLPFLTPNSLTAPWTTEGLDLGVSTEAASEDEVVLGSGLVDAEVFTSALMSAGGAGEGDGEGEGEGFTAGGFGANFDTEACSQTTS
jgi:hypothetical protein